MNDIRLHSFHSLIHWFSGLDIGQKGHSMGMNQPPKSDGNVMFGMEFNRLDLAM